MDQVRAIINLNEGVIQLEGPEDFVRHYLEKYAPAVKGISTSESRPSTSKRQAGDRGRLRGGQRSCTSAIRAEVKAGFFDKPRSTQAIREQLMAKGVTCSIGVLRAGLRKAVEEGRLGTDGRGRGLVYSRKVPGGEVV